MKSQFAAKLLSTRWHGTRERTRSVLAPILARLRSERPDEDVFGDPLPRMELRGDVAIIPIVGALMIGVPQWVKKAGLSITDADDIAEELDRAMHDPAVSMIVLDSDSPGGWSAAGDKLFADVQRAAAIKPVFGWIGDGRDCCSSAYEALTPSRAILAGPHALAVGCIGSYLAVLDDTEFWKQMGLTWEVFRSGDFKGMGEDSLSDDQRAWLQEQVEESGAGFRAKVAGYRTALDPAEMQGQYYGGIQAAAKNFIHGTARNLQSAIAIFRSLI